MNYIGKGLYTYPEVAQLTGLSSQKIRRWAEGYDRRDTDKHMAPVFDTDYEKLDNKKVLSFLDLIEVLFIKSFTQYHISIQTIRKALKAASDLLQSSHPFAMKKIYTDGKTILAHIARESETQELIDLIQKQYQFTEIVLPTLYECIDFNHYEVAERWWPLGRDKGVVVDPARNFGKPIIDRVNISVDMILDLYRSGHSVEAICDWYEIEQEYVELAVSFNKQLSA